MRGRVPVATWSDVVESTTDPAFVIGDDGRILAWNRTVARELDQPSDSAVGRHCHRLLMGRGIAGDVVCRRDCPLRARLLEQGASSSLQLTFPDGLGVRRLFRVSLVAVPAPGNAGRAGLLHLLAPMGVPVTATAPPRPRPAELPRCNLLTRRENDVLQCLAQGMTTAEIARDLRISAATVRRHVENVLRKLGVHSRLEAVLKCRDGDG